MVEPCGWKYTVNKSGPRIDSFVALICTSHKQAKMCQQLLQTWFSQVGRTGTSSDQCQTDQKYPANTPRLAQCQHFVGASLAPIFLVTRLGVKSKPALALE